MSVRALHISHTDIRSDSRILKEIAAVATMADSEVIGIGVEEDRKGAPMGGQEWAFRLQAIRLLSRRMKRLPRVLYLGMSFFELTIRLILLGAPLKPQIVHCHDTLVLPAGVLIKWLTGARLIYDAHELESDKNGQTFALSKATLWMEKTCWRWVDGFISVSEGIVDWYMTRFPRKPSSVVLNSPIFKPRQGHDVVARPLHFREAFGILPASLIFVYIGILARGRGIETLLDVFSAPGMPAHLVFMGYGDLDMSISAASAQHANIHLHNPVPHDLVVEYASGADVGLCFVENVSLSDYYCLPNKLFEYSFAGIPVLASDFPEIRRVVEQFSLGKVCHPGRESVLAAVLSFVDKPPERGAASDLSSLSWDQQTKRLVSLYQRLLQQ
jgi:glycosyltransferase involved in cell wall biosynthesis